MSMSIKVKNGIEVRKINVKGNYFEIILENGMASIKTNCTKFLKELFCTEQQIVNVHEAALSIIYNYISAL